MKNKFKLYYRVVASKHPTSRVRVLRPQICDRETYYSEQVISTALERGYIRGQYEDSLGTFRGALECVKKLGLEGKAVNLGFFRVHSELTGQVDETRQLTDANELHVAITALQDLKANVDDYNWSRIDDNGVIVKIEKITSPDGCAGEITRGKAIVANGKNLAYNAAWGDRVTVSCGDLSAPIELTPCEQSETYLRFDWPTALDAVAVGTVLAFEFCLHGAKGAAEQGSSLGVRLVGGDTPSTPKVAKVTQEGRADDTVLHAQTSPCAIHGTGLRLGAEDKVLIELWRDGACVDEGDLTAGGKVVSSTDAEIKLSGFCWNNRTVPDGDWWDAYPDSKLIVVKDGVRIEHPVTFKGE